jgi:hypothetical protein
MRAGNGMSLHMRDQSYLNELSPRSSSRRRRAPLVGQPSLLVRVISCRPFLTPRNHAAHAKQHIHRRSPRRECSKVNLVRAVGNPNNMTVADSKPPHGVRLICSSVPRARYKMCKTG